MTPHLPPGSWTSRSPGSTAGLRAGAHRLRVRGSVEGLRTRLVVDPSGAATLTGTVPERRLFVLSFDAGAVTYVGEALELDGLLALGGDPTRVVARGRLLGVEPKCRRLILETVFDRRQLGLTWDAIDDVVTLYADLVLEREDPGWQRTSGASEPCLVCVPSPDERQRRTSGPPHGAR